MKRTILFLLTSVLLLGAIGCSNHMDGGNYYPSPYYESGEEYLQINENQFVVTTDDPTSTFSLDTSTAGYANLRRLINNNDSISMNQVKLEEMVNYFSYDYQEPTGEDALAISSEIMDCPWNSNNKLVSIGVKARAIENIPATKNNIVLLLDVSGSMSSQNKLPLMQAAFKLFVETLDEEDTVSIVTYAGSNRVALNGANGSEKKRIVTILEDLMAGGSTGGSGGIKTAYQVASEHFIQDGNNRVILGTDGDFNVGISGTNELEKFIAEKRDTGVYLSVLGFGYGNYKDDKLATLASAGNGNHAYIDSIIEARKVLVEEIGGTLNIVAKDTKTQVNFNPLYVKEYRLLGYENKLISDEEFEDERADAGEIGAGHTTTAVYELVMNNEGDTSGTNNWLNVVIRYKDPATDISKEITKAIDATSEKDTPSEDFLFISGVLETGLILRDSPYKGESSYPKVLLRISQLPSVTSDEYKSEFVTLVQKLNNKLQ